MENPNLPKVVLIGRPNVGKSTLFNRLIRSNRAITHDRPGVTRDRMEGRVAPHSARPFILVDCGGLTLSGAGKVAQGPRESQGFEEHILRQAEAAIQEATLVCFVVDGRDGLTPFDEFLADYLRKHTCPVLLVINKIDGYEREDLLLADFYGLGFDLAAVSAEHGHNLRGLLEEIQSRLPKPIEAQPEEVIPGDAKPAPLKLCLLGRPNAGKSSIVNAFLGMERMIVSEAAGTTRDSVDVPFSRNGRQYVFVDTAGVRRKAKITDIVEKYSVNSSIKSTTKADVTFLVIDASDGVAIQDKRLAELLDERKTPFIIVLNKIDLLPKSERAGYLKEFTLHMSFCPHIPIVPVSAVTGAGLDKLLPLADEISRECEVRIPTGQLNRAMEQALAKHQAPVVRRVRPKIFYLTQAESTPPTFVIFVNDAERVAESYVRYLEKSLRKTLGIKHAPMRVNLRSSHTKNKGQKVKRNLDVEPDRAY